MPGGVPPSVVRERERVAWRLKKRFWTDQRIADHLGITQQAVNKILQRVQARVLEELKADIEATKARQTAQLEVVAEEAFGAWERSRLDAETVKIVTAAEPKGADDGKGQGELTVREERTLKGQSGDPNLLNQARGALADIRKIWGLDAPTKTAISAFDDFDADPDTDLSEADQGPPPQPGEPSPA